MIVQHLATVLLPKRHIIARLLYYCSSTAVPTYYGLWYIFRAWGKLNSCVRKSTEWFLFRKESNW